MASLTVITLTAALLSVCLYARHVSYSCMGGATGGRGWGEGEGMWAVRCTPTFTVWARRGYNAIFTANYSQE